MAVATPKRFVAMEQRLDEILARGQSGERADGSARHVPGEGNFLSGSPAVYVHAEDLGRGVVAANLEARLSCRVGGQKDEKPPVERLARKVGAVADRYPQGRRLGVTGQQKQEESGSHRGGKYSVSFAAVDSRPPRSTQG